MRLKAQSQQFLLPEGAKVMRKTFSVSSASSVTGRLSPALRPMAAMMGGVALVALMLSSAHAQQAQGAWAVPSGNTQSGGPSLQGKGGIAVLPPSPEGKLPTPFPSAVIGTPEKPLSSSRMPLSSAKIDKQIDQAIQDADVRLKDVNMSVGPAGSGNLKVAPLPVSTLNDDIRAASLIHRMQVQKAEVQGAVELWGAAYDGKREMPSPAANGATPQNGFMAPGVGAPVSSPKNTVQDRVRQAQDEAAEREREEARIRAEEAARQASEMKQKKQEMAGMLPVVSSIVGDPENAVATILIPFVGEKHGVIAGDSIQTYSGRILNVVSVTENGVTVREGRKSYRLRSGDTVPSPAQGVAMLAAHNTVAQTDVRPVQGRIGGALQSSGNMPLSGKSLPGR